VLLPLIQQQQLVSLQYFAVEQQVASILQNKTKEVLRNLLSKIGNIQVNKIYTTHVK
jgi:hypothetical protein